MLIMAGLPAAAQDSSTSEQVIKENDRIKIVVTEKQTSIGDSVVKGTETLEIIRKNKGDTIRFAEDAEGEMDFNLEACDEPSKPSEPKFIETDWMSFQLGLNNVLNQSGGLGMSNDFGKMDISTGNSINFHWHIVRQGVNLYRDKVRFVYGVGIDYNNYRFKNDVQLSKAPDSLNNVLVASENEQINYKKNKLVTQYLTVPLMLSFDLGNGDDDGFKVSLGANFGYLIGSHQKLKWNDNGKQTSKIRDDYNLEQFRMGYELQFGYNNLILYAKYFPNSMFKQDLGPDVRTVSAGIVLGSI